MSEYNIIAVLWEDHISKLGAEIPENPDSVFAVPTLTVGILLCETAKSLLIAHDIERLTDVDNSIYTVILKHAVIGVPKVFGQIELKEIRWKG